MHHSEALDMIVSSICVSCNLRNLCLNVLNFVLHHLFCLPHVSVAVNILPLGTK